MAILFQRPFCLAINTPRKDPIPAGVAFGGSGTGMGIPGRFGSNRKAVGVRGTLATTIPTESEMGIQFSIGTPGGRSAPGCALTQDTSIPAVRTPASMSFEKERFTCEPSANNER
jgi:hypothetical protein